MTVPLRKRVKRSVRSALLVAAVRLLALLPLRVALALGTAVGRAPGAEQVFRGVLARGRGLVYVAGHVGNWELMAQRVPRIGPFPAATIAKATIHPGLNVLIERTRAAGGVETLWREDPATARAMIRCFKQNKILGILIDQDTSVQGVFVPFFGRPAFTPRAAADLALPSARRSWSEPAGGAAPARAMAT